MAKKMSFAGREIGAAVLERMKAQAAAEGNQPEEVHKPTDSHGNVITDAEMANIRASYSKSISQGLLAGRPDDDSAFERLYHELNYDETKLRALLSADEISQLVANNLPRITAMEARGETAKAAELRAALTRLSGSAPDVPRLSQEDNAALQMLGAAGLAQVGRDPRTGERVHATEAGVVKRSDLLREYSKTTDMNGEIITE